MANSLKNRRISSVLNMSPKVILLLDPSKQFSLSIVVFDRLVTDSLVSCWPVNAVLFIFSCVLSFSN